MIRSIFAVDAGGGLGKDGTLPWPKDPEDLRWFRTNTTGGIVIMGKNTWIDPMMPKPLPNRFNIVVTSKDFHSCDAAHMVVSGVNLDSTLRNLAAIHDRRPIWIIGGAQLLKSTAHLVEQIYLTRFDQSYGCDVTIDVNSYLRDFDLVSETPGTGKRFQTYHAKLSGSTQ
jgi:dihydrofolate reductase